MRKSKAFALMSNTTHSAYQPHGGLVTASPFRKQGPRLAGVMPRPVRENEL